MKRAFDITGSLFGLAILAPLIALIAVAVWIEDRRSPLFWGNRGARGGGHFRMVKFRTMVPDAWKTGVNSTAAGDRRITRVGRVLRAAKLDELPQLWNVLTGDMSLVGPRPQVATDAALYTQVERRMLTVRPGITDLASIVFADEGRILAGSADPDLFYNQTIRPWKSRLALLGIERGHLAIDVCVLLLTALAAISRAGALAGVTRILEAWNTEPMLLRMSRRLEPLLAWPPPGASQIVADYPRACPATTANAVEAALDETDSRIGRVPA
jgi:lipopolysaccharide/colanic/teichoic acid biosynthesis glycosyltransferase